MKYIDEQKWKRRKIPVPETWHERKKQLIVNALYSSTHLNGEVVCQKRAPGAPQGGTPWVLNGTPHGAARWSSVSDDWERQRRAPNRIEAKGRDEIP